MDTLILEEESIGNMEPIPLMKNRADSEILKN